MRQHTAAHGLEAQATERLSSFGMKIWLEVFRRFSAISSVVLWLGGFTFYAGVVVPTGAQVLHSHLKQGFITQQVTSWLNLIGILALAILLWNVLATKYVRRWSLWISLGTWVAMAALQIALFILHPMMDRLLDIPAHKVIDTDRFDSLHTLYGALATVQWSCGVLHVFVILFAWTVTNGSLSSLPGEEGAGYGN